MTKAEAIILLQSRVDLIKKDYPDIADYAEALELAIEALNHFAGDSKKVSFSCGQENDMVYRQAVIDDLDEWIDIYGENKCVDAQDILKQAKRSIKKLPSAQPERTCVNCGRTANNGGWYADGGTRCPIEEHYALPKDGYCHLWEKRNVTDDDYPERREE